MSQIVNISIHALLAESDEGERVVFATGDISIHALLAESDASTDCCTGTRSTFLSTLSLRRATVKRSFCGRL